MSQTTTAPVNASEAVAVAKEGSHFVALVQTADPALYAQLVGSLATYSKSAAAPLVGSVLGLLVAKYGLGPYVTPDILNLATEALVAIGVSAGAAAMHWLSKAPGRALQASSPSQGIPK
jgi:hypothetical protein